MATQAAIRQRVFDYLYGSYPTDHPFVTRINASYNNSTTSITVFEDDNWEVGDTLENISTAEQMRVIAKAGANVLTVIRNWNGTTAAASVGTTDPVTKNPRFTVKRIDDAIAATLVSLAEWDIHVFGTGSIVRADPREFYEIADTDIVDHLGVLRVYEVDPNDFTPKSLPFRYQYSLGVGSPEYAVGHGVWVQDWGAHTTNGESVWYAYAKLINETTDLLTRQEELIVVGAGAQVFGGSIIPSTQDPGARTDRTVQPGQTSRDVRYFQGRFISEARVETALLAVERAKMLKESVKAARARRWVN